MIDFFIVHLIIIKKSIVLATGLSFLWRITKFLYLGLLSHYEIAHYVVHSFRLESFYHFYPLADIVSLGHFSHRVLIEVGYAELSLHVKLIVSELLHVV